MGSVLLKVEWWGGADDELESSNTSDDEAVVLTDTSELSTSVLEPDLVPEGGEIGIVEFRERGKGGTTIGTD